MKTCVDVLAAAREKLGGVSQRRLAKELGVTVSYVNAVTNRRQAIGEGLAVKLAAIIGCEPALIMAIAAGDRESDPELRASWRRIVSRATAAVVACVIFTSSGIEEAAAESGAGEGFSAAAAGRLLSSVYTLCALGAQWVAALLRPFERCRYSAA